MRRVVLMSVVCLMACGVANAEQIRWLPVAASNPGEYGTQWATDVWIFTRVVDSPVEVMVSFYPDLEGAASPTEVAVEVPAGSALAIHDIVATVFNESRPGALRFRSEYPFEVQSRTFNDGGEHGSFGQGIAAVAPENVVEGWVLVGAANVPGDDGVRSNLGLLNPNDEAAEGLLMLIDQEDGSVIATTRVEIGAFGWMQTDVFEMLGMAGTRVDNAVVLGVLYPSVQSYLSRVDNRSGDGTFVLPFDAESAYIVPTDWDVAFTLSWSSGVTIDQIAYTGEDGSDVVVSSPTASPFTVTLAFTSPARFCYSASGTAASGGGSITGEIVRTRAGDQPRQDRHVVGGSAGGPINTEDCVDLF